jgi:hypothetical protein
MYDIILTVFYSGLLHQTRGDRVVDFYYYIVYKTDDEETTTPCPPFSKYLYFLFAPTLVYRDNYPR